MHAYVLYICSLFHDMGYKGFLANVLNFLVVLMRTVFPASVLAKEYAVGDEEGWNSDVDYYSWLDGKTFHVADVLVFNHTKEDHNVIVVNATGYDQCISCPNLGAYNSGNDRITLNAPGNKHYICQWHCDYSDQKLNVTVLPKRTTMMMMLAPAPAPQPAKVSPSSSQRLLNPILKRRWRF